MSDNSYQQSNQTARVRHMLVAALVLGCAFGTATKAAAQRITPPETPILITPPEGNTAYLSGHGVGTQGYVCLPTTTGASWTVNAARPEATLFASFFGQGLQIITHFQSPDTDPRAPKPVAFGNATWQSSFDSSVVWAQASHSIPAGSDPSCPHAGAVSCLLLESIGSKKGPTGGKVMTETSFIQRLNTQGGSAPATGCSAAGDVGKQTLVPYSADYFFFRADK
jgi:hypothetical protein